MIAAENNERIPHHGGVTGKGFQPGQTGNPGGRPKGLAALVRAATGDGEDIVQFYLDVFAGKKRANGKRSSLKLRMEAAQWLSDRGWGKAEMIVDDKRDKPVLVVYSNGHGDTELP